MKTHLDLVRETWGTVETYVREVWGAGAVFDVVDKHVVVHLDNPTPETRAARIAAEGARAAELVTADCPLCREMALTGGDEVFDGSVAETADAILATA